MLNHAVDTTTVLPKTLDFSLLSEFFGRHTWHPHLDRLPEHDDLAVFVFAHRSAKLICLAHAEPERRHIFGRRQQKEIDAAIDLLRYEVARRSG